MGSGGDVVLSCGEGREGEGEEEGSVFHGTKHPPSVTTQTLLLIHIRALAHTNTLTHSTQHSLFLQYSMPNYVKSGLSAKVRSFMTASQTEGEEASLMLGFPGPG